MSEYRHIANLTGPQGQRGADATEVPGASYSNPIVLSSDDDLDALDPGIYHVNFTSIAEDLGLPYAGTGAVEVLAATLSARHQRFTATSLTSGGIWVRNRGVGDGGTWTEWEQIYPPQHGQFSEASERIKDLARRDGWAGVYDPTDPTTTEVDSQGRVRTIHDGLGNLNRMAAEGEDDSPPTLLHGEFGQINGMGGDTAGSFIRGYYGTTFSEAVTILVLARDTKPVMDDSSERRWLTDARGSTSTRQGIFVTPSSGAPSYQVNGGRNALAAARHDTSAHLFRATYKSETDSAFTIDGDFETESRGSNDATGLTLGADVNGENPWVGSFGVALVYSGEISSAKVNRMSSLIKSLAGIPDTPPSLDYSTVAYSENAHGQVTFSHGNPDAIDEDATVASITKVMTLWVARKYLSDADLDTTVEIAESDIRGSADRIVPDDVVSYRDLFSLASLPSDNTAPRAIARTVGTLILDGEAGDPEDRFHQEMQDEADSLGYEGARFTNPQFGAWMSAQQVVDLFRRSMEDPQLREVYEKTTDTITVEGPAPRSVDITHSIESASPFRIPGFAGGKTGTNYGYGHVVVAWEHPDGSEHITVILNAPSSDSSRRYRELRKVIAHISAG